MKKTLTATLLNSVAFAAAAVQTVFESMTPQSQMAFAGDTPQKTFGSRFESNLDGIKSAMGLDEVRRNESAIALLTGKTETPQISQRDGSMVDQGQMHGATSFRTSETGVGGDLPGGSMATMGSAYVGDKGATSEHGRW